MPSNGKKQNPAGVNKSPHIAKLGNRKMESANRLMRTGFTIENCQYKGNPVFNANE
jgi:hypothetical protein